MSKARGAITGECKSSPGFVGTCKLSEQLPAPYLIGILTAMLRCSVFTEGELVFSEKPMKIIPRHKRQWAPGHRPSIISGVHCSAKDICGRKQEMSFCSRYLCQPVESWTSTVPPYLGDTPRETTGQGQKFVTPCPHEALLVCSALDPLLKPPQEASCSHWTERNLRLSTVASHSQVTQMSLKPVSAWHSSLANSC